MALNKESILAQYQAAADIASKRATGLAQTAAGSKTFASDLQRRIAQREVSPEAASREREVISQVFAAPEEMRARLKDTRLLPSEVGELVGGSMNTYLDQLQSIRDSRSARRSRIDNIVEDAAAGVKAQAEIAGIELNSLKDTRDTLWKQYTESERQYEWKVNQARLGSQEKEFQKKIRVTNEINQIFTGTKRGGDGGYDPNVYNTVRQKWFSEFGTYSGFEESFPVSNYINVFDSPNATTNIRTLEKIGIDIYEPLRAESDASILSDLQRMALDIANSQNPGNHDPFILQIESLINSGILLDRKDLSKDVIYIAKQILTEEEYNNWLAGIEANFGDDISVPTQFQGSSQEGGN